VNASGQMPIVDVEPARRDYWGSTPGRWYPGSNGAGKRRWFLWRTNAETGKTEHHDTRSGLLVRYASYEAAQKAADRLNRTPPGPSVVNVEARRVVRYFQKFTAEQRADRAASRRLGRQQRREVGSFFYTHPDVPGRAFDTRRQAAQAAVARSNQEPDQ